MRSPDATPAPLAAPADDGGRAADRRLALAAADGDTSAFETIVERHGKRLLRLAWRLLGNAADAEDLLQDVLVRAHRALPGFRGDASLKTWLTRIAVNAARNRRRDDRRKRLHVMDSLDAPIGRAAEDGGTRRSETVADERAGPEQLARSAEAGRRMQEAIGELGPEFREPLVLREVEGLAYREIAELLGIELGTVKSRIARARARLQDRLADLVRTEPRR